MTPVSQLAQAWMAGISRCVAPVNPKFHAVPDPVTVISRYEQLLLPFPAVASSGAIYCELPK